MAPRILFVCLGNICRSPTAEAVLRHHAPDWTVDSAGTSDWHVGDAPYGPMQQVAMRRGYDLSSLRARQFGPRDFHEFDLILGMDSDNIARIAALRPESCATPVRCLTDFALEAGADHVPDPYYTRDFDATLDLIEICIRRLVENPFGGV